MLSAAAGSVDSLRALPRFTKHLIWGVAGFALAVAPHVPDLKFWIVLLAAGLAVLRLTIEIKQWRIPPKWALTVVGMTCILAVLLSYRSLNGLEAGTAFLVVTGALKLLETRTVRDLTVLTFVSYFLLFAGFLYDQSLLRLPWMLVTVWFLTTTLMRTHQTAPMRFREALLFTGKLLLQSVPLAILLFLFFPRLPGAFWSMPARDRATMGLNEEVSPGDVSELSVSGAIAFRVHFDGALPPPRERYWRGLVLHDFDGRTWRRLPVYSAMQEVEPRGKAYDYEITLEPHNRRWVFGMDAVTRWPEARAARTFDQQLVAREAISTMASFTLRSHSDYRVIGPLPATARKMDLRTGEGNPRSKQFAADLRARAGSDAAFVRALLDKFRDEEYFYTLEPPRLAANAVDEFLFDTRRGFCEHFASAFTVMARAAGIPARVVVGYQGGEYNPMGDYLIVRQSDAHAWSEVWLDSQGWVRVDPTAAVSPERVERGLDAAMSQTEPVPGRFIARSTTLTQARLAWDAINTFWNNQIVEFGATQQRTLLALLGAEDADWKALGLALLTVLVGSFAALSMYLAWQFRPRTRDPVARIYAQLCRRLAAKQLPRLPHEGPTDYLNRIMQARPELAKPLTETRALYISLRYGPTPLTSQISRLKFLVGQLKL